METLLVAKGSVEATKADGSFEDSVCVLRFVKPSYETDVTGLHHELLEIRRITRF